MTMWQFSSNSMELLHALMEAFFSLEAKLKVARTGSKDSVNGSLDGMPRGASPDSSLCFQIYAFWLFWKLTLLNGL